MITTIVSISSTVWALFQYFDTRKRELRFKEFETYHKLIKELVEPDNSQEKMYIDRQSTILFELRNYKKYYPLSYRTLSNLKEKWKKEQGEYERLLEELDLTLNFLEKKVKNHIITRIFASK